MTIQRNSTLICFNFPEMKF